MAKFLSNIGPSDELRMIVSKFDIDRTPISLQLDQHRNLRIREKSYTRDELFAVCSDVGPSGATVTLHLPYAPGSAGQAWIIEYN